MVLEEHGKVQVHKLYNLCFYARRSAEAIDDYSVGGRNPILRRRKLSCALPVNHHLVVRNIDLHLIYELIKWDREIYLLFNCFVPSFQGRYGLGTLGTCA